VNYRTPSQIADAAEQWAIQHGLPVTPSKSVRESEWPIAHADDVVEAVRHDRSLDASGTLAVIAPVARIAATYDLLTQEFDGQVALGSDSLMTPITVLSPQEAKGLEFDSVVIEDPEGIVEESERGAGALYVSMTRPTQRLTLVGRLPEPGA